jgi:hypothetical protein
MIRHPTFQYLRKDPCQRLPDLEKSTGGVPSESSRPQGQSRQSPTTSPRHQQPSRDEAPRPVRRDVTDAPSSQKIKKQKTNKETQWMEGNLQGINRSRAEQGETAVERGRDKSRVVSPRRRRRERQRW